MDNFLYQLLILRKLGKITDEQLTFYYNKYIVGLKQKQKKEAKILAIQSQQDIEESQKNKPKTPKPIEPSKIIKVNELIPKPTNNKPTNNKPTNNKPTNNKPINNKPIKRPHPLFHHVNKRIPPSIKQIQAKLDPGLEIKKYHQKLLNDDTKIMEEQAKYIKTLLGLNRNEKLVKLSQSHIIKEFTAEHNHSRKVVLLEGFIVRKMIDQTSFGNYLFWNEVRSLLKLLPYRHFPKLIAYDPNRLLIYMTYCGNMITSKNMPSDWKKQLEDIKNILLETRVNSNDMSTRNTCVIGDRIHIIDFGLNTIFQKDINQVIQHFHGDLVALASRRR